MTSFLFVKYLHFASIFLVVSTLVAEVLLVKPTMTRAEIKKLARIDSIYGLGAILTLGAGFVLWFWVGKPATFYSDNVIFWIKIALFTLVGILSIWPTVFFIRQQKGDPKELVSVPVQLRRMIKFEIVIVWILPLLAVLMANGYNLFQ